MPDCRTRGFLFLDPGTMSAKAKASGVNVSSFWDLKAELSKQEANLSATKAKGGQIVIKGGVQRPEKVSLVAC